MTEYSIFPDFLDRTKILAIKAGAKHESLRKIPKNGLTKHETSAFMAGLVMNTTVNHLPECKQPFSSDFYEIGSKDDIHRQLAFNRFYSWAHHGKNMARENFMHFCRIVAVHLRAILKAETAEFQTLCTEVASFLKIPATDVARVFDFSGAGTTNGQAPEGKTASPPAPPAAAAAQSKRKYDVPWLTSRARLIVPSTHNIGQYRAFEKDSAGVYDLYRRHSQDGLIVRESFLIQRVEGFEDAEEGFDEQCIKGDLIGYDVTRPASPQQHWNMVGMVTGSTVNFHLWRTVSDRVIHEYMQIQRDTAGKIDLATAMRSGMSDDGKWLCAIWGVVRRQAGTHSVTKDQFVANAKNHAGPVTKADPLQTVLKSMFFEDKSARGPQHSPGGIAVLFDRAVRKFEEGRLAAAAPAKKPAPKRAGGGSAPRGKKKPKAQ